MSYTKDNTPIRGEAPHGDYELIDVDPYIGRVLSYMRPTDLTWWATLTAATPLSLVLWEKCSPAAGPNARPGKVPGGILRAATFSGFVGGFFFAYIRSSTRFMGWSENAREVKMDRYEIKKLLYEEKLPYHENESRLSDRLQDVANRNSQHSFVVSTILPWFNLVYHPYHGVEMQKYYENRPGEEEWGFNNLKPYDEIKAKYAKVIE